MKLIDYAKNIGLLATIFLMTNVNIVQAAEGPVDKGITLQPAASEVAHDIASFHNAVLMPVMVGISLLVLVLLIYVGIRFNEKVNPKPATFTHNVPLEIAWTAVPVLILIFIAIFSFPLLYKEDVTPAKYDVTVKVTGNQWYWSYEYPDADGISLTANMLTEEEAKAQNKPFQFATDAALVVPVNKVVRVQITASDVIHSWALPAFGVKIDAVPGTLNETWFKAERTGTFYGQCSEICGIRHAFMPIEIKVVTDTEYAAWLASHKTADASPVQLAQAQ